MNALRADVVVATFDTTVDVRYTLFVDDVVVGEFPGPIVRVNFSYPGPHTVVAQAVDLAGNVDPSPPAALVLAATSSPRTAVATSPISSSSNVSVGLTCSGVPTVLYAGVTLVLSTSAAGSVSELFRHVIMFEQPAGHASSDNSTVIVDTGNRSATWTFTGLASDWYQVSASCFDIIGNSDPIGQLARFAVVTSPPHSSFSEVPPRYTNNSRLRIAVAGASYHNLINVSIQVGIDGDWLAVVNATNSSVYLSPPVGDGDHDIVLSAIDAAGNHQLPPLPRASVVVDTVAPAVVLVHDNSSLPEATNQQQVRPRGVNSEWCVPRTCRHALQLCGLPHATGAGLCLRHRRYRRDCRAFRARR